MNAERGTMNEKQLVFRSSFIVPRSSFLFRLHLRLCAAAVGEFGQTDCEQSVAQFGGCAAHAHGPTQRDRALEAAESSFGTVVRERAARRTSFFLTCQAHLCVRQGQVD